EGLLPPPAYFPYNVAMNKKGYNSFEEVLAAGKKPLSPVAFEVAVESSGAVVLDTREAAIFAKGFIPRSINIGIKGDFAPWVGAIISDVNQPILIVCDPGQEEEVITRLARVGFDKVLGYLDGGFESWKNAGKEIDTVNRISATQFAHEYRPNSIVIDVRKESEYQAEHVQDAYNKPLAYINEWTKQVPNEHFYIHCAGGYRSMIAASILKARGIHHFSEIDGGFKAISQTAIPKTDYVCQSKMMKV
ncbi:MAG: rhodanese-like domain-containing protein, partial [Bacteroidia bacterium]|nr:rhodanese-like domain-containing protein [Bacteroidia bacterium]